MSAQALEVRGALSRAQIRQIKDASYSLQVPKIWVAEDMDLSVESRP
ncbi:hypothetical protein G0R26_002941 [Salmonella enterica]|nr:hypothetical protein [Salmonella enterica]